ncbi:hypothetical protein GTY23_23125 [Streptomyces sp. SID5998]|nr:hypothetical protein [Streptomyces sp. SID5998]
MTAIDPLAAIVHLEAAVFRAGQVARRLVAEHLDLTVKRVSTHAFSTADAYDSPSAKAVVELFAEDLDGARAWATVLGVDLALKTSDATSHVFEHGRCTAEVDGVEIAVSGFRDLSAEEAAAWRAEQTGGES